MFKRLWDKYWTWRATDGKIVHTIVIARVKLVLGMGFTALQQSGVDIAALISQDPIKQGAVRIGFAWLAVDGTITEWGRRHGAEDIGPLPPIPPVPPIPTFGPK